MTGAELPCSLQGICDAEQSCRASLPPRGVHGGSEAGKDALKGCPNAVLPPHPYPELQVHRASPQKEGAGAQPPPPSRGLLQRGDLGTATTEKEHFGEDLQAMPCGGKQRGNPAACEPSGEMMHQSIGFASLQGAKRGTGTAAHHMLVRVESRTAGETALMTNR